MQKEHILAPEIDTQASNVPAKLSRLHHFQTSSKDDVVQHTLETHCEGRTSGLERRVTHTTLNQESRVRVPSESMSIHTNTGRWSISIHFTLSSQFPLTLSWTSACTPVSSRICVLAREGSMQRLVCYMFQMAPQGRI